MPASLREDEEESKKLSITRSEIEALLNYTMESSMFDFAKLRRDRDFKIKKYRDAVYRGTLNAKGGRHGRGVMLYSNNRVYEGEWVGDVRDGVGYERYANGNVYQGEFKRGKAHGKGKYVWTSGEMYDGEWMGGQKHGYGCLLYTSPSPRDS